MNGATQTLNELLAPVMNLLGIQDAWFIVACAAAVLFLLFFILFVSRCVKIRRLKATIREKDVEITGLATAARKQQGTDGADGTATSVVYSSSAAAGTASLTGEVNPYARVSGEGGADDAASFDDAWRSENTQFLEKCETGVMFEGGGSQDGRHFTDVLFGGARAGEDESLHVGDAADPSHRRKARQAQEQAAKTALEVERAAVPTQENPRLDQIRGIDLRTEEESSLFPEKDPFEPSEPVHGRSKGLSNKIPHL